MKEMIDLIDNLKYAQLNYQNAETDIEIDIAIAELRVAELKQKELIQRKKVEQFGKIYN